MKKKPKKIKKKLIKICWECGHKMRGNHLGVLILVDLHERLLHKQCVNKINEKTEKFQDYKEEDFYYDGDYGRS